MAGRLLFGFRDDLNLDQRWWHRLAKVAFALAVALGAITLSLLAHEVQVGSPKSLDVRVTHRFREFAMSRPGIEEGRVRVLQEFGQLDGELGRIDEGELAPTDYLPTDTDCMVLVLFDVDASNKVIDRSLACSDGNENVTEFLEGYVKYVTTPFGALRQWAMSIALSSLVLAVLALVCLNLDYRGLVYIVYGTTTISHAGYLAQAIRSTKPVRPVV